MRVLVIQFLLGMFRSSRDHVLLSTNPRSRALRELLLNSPQHEFIMLSVNRGFKSEVYRGNPGMLFYDVPPTRIGWLLYVFLLALLARPRLTICFGIEMTAVASVASALTGSKVISVVGSDIDYLNEQYSLPKPVGVLANALVRLSLRRASHVFVPNQRVMDSIRRIARDITAISEYKYKVEEIFAPSVSREERDTSRKPVILTVARLSPVKGLEYLVAAAKEILKSIPEATFVVQSAYPNPAYQSHLERVMIHEGVRDHFKFCTQALPNSEMPKLYNSADIFVLPSLSEGRNSAVLEALACGLPVVATKVGANDEAVVDMKNGFLVEPKDAAALANCITRILSDRNLWLRFSEAARVSSAWSPEYDLGTMLKAATAVFEQ